jgi:UDP-N-acetylmuramoyl-L-alanyl-D-glutamate--2,6-diaminopimelate ligase
MERPLAHYQRSLGSIASLLGFDTANGGVMITGVTQDSQAVEPGDIFLAFPGAKVHGASFSDEAIRRGARAILTDEYGARIVNGVTNELPVVVVTNPRRSAGILSAWFYDEPMRDMYSVGITGTNGKTTTTTLLHQIWTHAGRESGLIGTIETRIGSDLLKSTRTTPESSDLQALAATMRERHVRNFVMEVSSHGISLERIRGSHFAAVAFTNLTQDHLDFHATMEEYFQAKKAIFTFEYAEFAIINIDDPYGVRLAASVEIPFRTISRHNQKADWTYEFAVPDVHGNDVNIRGPGGILIEALLPLHGDYNLSNALMAIALAYESGVNPVEIAAILPTLSSAKGRLEPVNVGQNFSAFIDYAHSPDAVSRVLETCRSMTTGRVIAVLGCGGDRDSSKRPLMGKALSGGSDVAVFTSDNPRSEDPGRIIQNMVAGIAVDQPDKVVLDRRSAIKYAVSQALPGDIVVILGKGHESGQEIAGVITPFDDRLELAYAIEACS